MSQDILFYLSLVPFVVMLISPTWSVYLLMLVTSCVIFAYEVNQIGTATCRASDCSAGWVNLGFIGLGLILFGIAALSGALRLMARDHARLRKKRRELQAAALAATPPQV